MAVARRTVVAVEEQARVVMFVRGRVQGVGFRWWARARAKELGLVGHARNLPDGRVEVAVQGPGDAVERLHGLLTEEPSTASRPGRVDGVTVQRHAAKDVSGFHER